MKTFEEVAQSCKIVNDANNEINNLYKEKLAYLEKIHNALISLLISVITLIILVIIVSVSGSYNFNKDLGITISGAAAIFLIVISLSFIYSYNGKIKLINTHITTCVNYAKQANAAYTEPNFTNPTFQEYLNNIWYRVKRNKYRIHSG